MTHKEWLADGRSQEEWDRAVSLEEFMSWSNTQVIAENGGFMDTDRTIPAFDAATMKALSETFDKETK